ncbi:RHS repeat domain-containing protein [Pontibacter sp. H259]|uniref:RHS repeat domain-containing protein n=1 Tax=Pontibacter sp. H259 TaxID=3133421 RepID=UPI0030C3DEA4
MKTHFTKAAFSLLTMAALTLTACDDSNDNEDPDTDPIPTACVLTKMVDDAGNKTTFTYNDQGYVTTISYENTKDFDYGSLITNYIYDSNNQVIRQEYQENGEDAGYTAYTYFEGFLTKSDYYKNGVLVKTENFSYNDGRIVRITDSNGNEKTFTYNSKGNITEIRSTEGDKIVRTVYNGHDEMKTPYSAVKGYLYASAYSKNNPVYSSTYHVTNTQEVMITNSVFRYYEYNDLNQPTNIEEQQDNGFGLVINTNLTYDCD